MSFQNIWPFPQENALCIFRLQKGMIGKMIADHDRDLIVEDFDKVIVSDRRSHYGKSIVSDRRSRKM